MGPRGGGGRAASRAVQRPARASARRCSPNACRACCPISSLTESLEVSAVHSLAGVDLSGRPDHPPAVRRSASLGLGRQRGGRRSPVGPARSDLLRPPWGAVPRRGAGVPGPGAGRAADPVGVGRHQLGPERGPGALSRRGSSWCWPRIPVRAAWRPPRACSAPARRWPSAATPTGSRARSATGSTSPRRSGRCGRRSCEGGPARGRVLGGGRRAGGRGSRPAGLPAPRHRVADQRRGARALPAQAAPPPRTVCTSSTRPCTGADSALAASTRCCGWPGRWPTWRAEPRPSADEVAAAVAMRRGETSTARIRVVS